MVLFFAYNQLKFVDFILEFAVLFVGDEQVRSDVLIFGLGHVLLLLLQLIFPQFHLKLFYLRLIVFDSFTVLLLEILHGLVVLLW